MTRTTIESESTSSGSALPAHAVRILDGDCWAFFAFDVGHAIDLDAAQRLLDATPTAAPVAAQKLENARRQELPHGHVAGRRRAPASFQFHPPPLRIDQAAPEVGSLNVGGFSLHPGVECTLFEFGAISVAYRFPIRGGAEGLSLTSLLPLAHGLFDCALLREEATKRVTALSSRVSSAIDHPHVADIVEDYTVYHARSWSTAAPPASASAALETDSHTVARLLLGESAADLSGPVIESTLSSLVAYSRNDAAVIDWNAAIVLGPDEEDSLVVLEFANVELLETRFLDDRLDTALDRSYATVSRRKADAAPPRSPLGLLTNPHRDRLRRLAALQMENAVLFEGVNNALKLVGDQHLARLYAAAARRFHLAEWDANILRKLHTIDGLYQKLSDEQTTRRMEVLEWIIIILFVVSIVLPFLSGVGK